MSNLTESKQYTLAFDARADRAGCLLQKGQKIVYEEEEAEVIRVNPLLVIKTKNRVICGALYRRKRSDCASQQNTH